MAKNNWRPIVGQRTAWKVSNYARNISAQACDALAIHAGARLLWRLVNRTSELSEWTCANGRTSNDYGPTDFVFCQALAVMPTDAPHCLDSVEFSTINVYGWRGRRPARKENVKQILSDTLSGHKRFGPEYDQRPVLTVAIPPELRAILYDMGLSVESRFLLARDWAHDYLPTDAPLRIMLDVCAYTVAKKSTVQDARPENATVFV